MELRYASIARDTDISRSNQNVNEKQKKIYQMTYPWARSWVEAGEVASSGVQGDDCAAVEARRPAVSSEEGAVALSCNLQN